MQCRVNATRTARNVSAGNPLPADGHTRPTRWRGLCPRTMRSFLPTVLMLVLSVAAMACGGGARRAPSAPLAGDDTTLGVGDVLDVRVYGEEELTGTYRVAQDGTIDFPFIGRVAVAGL